MIRSTWRPGPPPSSQPLTWISFKPSSTGLFAPSQSPASHLAVAYVTIPLPPLLWSVAAWQSAIPLQHVLNSLHDNYHKRFGSLTNTPPLSGRNKTQSPELFLFDQITSLVGFFSPFLLNKIHLYRFVVSSCITVFLSVIAALKRDY